MNEKRVYVQYVPKDMFGFEVWSGIKSHKLLPEIIKKGKILKLTVELLDAGDFRGEGPGITIDECPDTKLPKEVFEKKLKPRTGYGKVISSFDYGEMEKKVIASNVDKG